MTHPPFEYDASLSGSTGTQDDGCWTEWINWHGGPRCPIPDAKPNQYELRLAHPYSPYDGFDCDPTDYAWGIVTHYRLRNPAAQSPVIDWIDAIARAVAAERERAAKVAESTNIPFRRAAIAAAIRSLPSQYQEPTND